MVKNLAKWTSERGQHVKIRLSDGCRRIQLPLGTPCRYDYDGFGGYLGNFGLDVSKIEERKLVLMEEELDVAEMVGSCCRLIKPRAKKGNINLENRVPNGPPTLFADERAIKQILLNLLLNAVKFTSKNGTVTFPPERMFGNKPLFAPQARRAKSGCK